MDRRQLYNEIKAGFVRQGTTLNKWCIANGINRQNARSAILGEWTGFTASYVVDMLISASGINKAQNSIAYQVSCPIGDGIGQPKVDQSEIGCPIEDFDIKGYFYE